MDSINEEFDRQPVLLAIDRESILAAINRLAVALGREVIPSVAHHPSHRARALGSLVAEAIATMDTVRDHLAAALATKSILPASLRGLRAQSPLHLADRIRQEHIHLRKEHEAACAAILDLQEERGAYRRGRADGLRLASRVAVDGGKWYARQDELEEVAICLGGNGALAAVMLDLIDHPERWRPENPAPAQPDPLDPPPNPTEADLDEAAVAALAAIYGAPVAARRSLLRLAGILTSRIDNPTQGT